MSIFTVGRMCMKLAGRDAGRQCVIVDDSSSPFVLVDGNVRRKKVSVKHLEPLSKTLDIQKGASHDVVKKAFGELGLGTWETKPKEAKPRLRKQRGKKKARQEAKSEKKTAKKEAKKEVKKEAAAVSGEQA